MVTLSKMGNQYNRCILEIDGLSTDSKPIGFIEGQKITNGSTFFEMDTSKAFKYDEDNEKWYEL